MTRENKENFADFICERSSLTYKYEIKRITLSSNDVACWCLNLFDLYFLSEDALERDNFMSPEEAKMFGVVDHVLHLTPQPKTESNESWFL